VQLSCQVPISSVRADEARDGNRATVCEELRDFGDATDVLFTILGAEAEVFVQAKANVVAIKAVGGEVVWVAEESLFESDGNSGLARRGEACEPYCETLLATERGADGWSDG